MHGQNDGEEIMAQFRWLAFAAALALAPAGASAQSFLGKGVMPTTTPEMQGQYWSPKPTTLTPYVAPNKAHWKLSAILAAHKTADWVQPIVRNPDQEADYISMGPGKKTKSKFYPDDRMIFIVQDGAIKVTIDGAEPFTATKGFMVNVPYRHLFTLETVGDKPSLRFEVRQAGEPPVYPASETPDPYPGRTYTKVTMRPGPQKDDPTNPIHVDFFKDVAVGDKPYNDKFVWDDHFTSNILRGKGAPVPPATNKGHFHVGWTEFWFIAEGKIGYLIEGMPYFEADQGDIVTAAKGRWHRAAFAPGAPMSTRIPLNPRPPVLHNFEITGD
jgi:mannose-6-phosphate isomerase-like protein (cupin superfamily)